MKVCVIDLETSVNSPISSKAHAKWPTNKIVMYGVAQAITPTTTPQTVWTTTSWKDFSDVISACHADTIFVGHNLKFDLLYLLQAGIVSEAWLYQHKFWDTQLAEYLLSAQTNTYASLDELSEKAGGTLKDDKVKAMWEAGYKTEDIPKAILEEYLEGDVVNTYKVWAQQEPKISKWGMSKLFESQMGALLATVLMEHNGMAVDTDYIKSRKAELLEEVKKEEELLSTLAGGEYGWEDTLLGPFNPASTKHLSALLFGGEIKYSRKEVVGKYKNGKDKYGTKEYSYLFSPKYSPGSVDAYLTKTGVYSVDDAVLRKLSEDSLLATSVLNYRKLKKQLETYYVNLEDLTFPDGHVYPSLNMVSTKTGRLSCNKPNIQNQTTEGGIKRAYISRWGEEGRIVDFDYSQLEMAGLAILSKDGQLTFDINHGVDMHIELYKEMYGRTPSKEERKKFKPLSFGLVYGAGANTLAENAGCSVADAKKFIKVFYNRYPGVEQFHKDMVENAEKGRMPTKERTALGKPMGLYLHRTPTGRMYAFKEYDNEWKPKPSFSPTELKNWVVQGFSTGDIVPHMVGALAKKLVRSGMHHTVCPIVTVHDSIVLDIHESDLDVATNLCYNVLRSTSEEVAKHFGIEMPVKLSVGCNMGMNWQDMEEVIFDKE